MVSLMHDQDAKNLGLPTPPFLYTIDQVMGILVMHNRTSFVANYCYLDGRSLGPHPKDRLLLRDIATEGEKPEWRCSEHELTRWLKYRGFIYFPKGPRLRQ